MTGVPKDRFRCRNVPVVVRGKEKLYQVADVTDFVFRGTLKDNGDYVVDLGAEAPPAPAPKGSEIGAPIEAFVPKPFLARCLRVGAPANETTL